MSELDDSATWCKALHQAWPELEIRVWPLCGDPVDIDFALVWNPAPGTLRQFRNLRLIVNLGAGVDAIAADRTLPETVPIMRLADVGQAQMMNGYVLLAVLRHHRDFYLFEQAKREHRWAYTHARAHATCRVGVMGLGYLGAQAACALAGQGFDVAGWSRSRKSLPGVDVFAGREALTVFLQRTDILVAMLPATVETRHIIDQEVFHSLPRGAKFVNVGRGSIVDEAALLEALEDGHISEATLDVFETEPLPPEHPFWALDQVMITPHLASSAIPESAAMQVADNCRRILSGQTAEYIVDRTRGY